jgi:hypothetical protein
MRTKAITITIPQPCSQNWEEMEKQDRKRFCKSCQKSVIDFSGYSNTEIIRMLSTSTNSICGRLTNRQLEQLNYHLMVLPAQRNWMKYLGVLAIGTSIFMQSCDKVETTVPIENTDKKTTSENPEKVLTIYGYVVDDYKMPIVGVKVKIENTNLFTITDKIGRYEFKLDENLKTKNNLLRVSSDSYEGSIVPDYTRAAQKELEVEKKIYVTTGVIMVAPVEVKKEN